MASFFSLFSLVDPRYVCYVPSVFAAATMLHVIHQMEPCNPLHYENQLLGVLNISEVVFLPLSYRFFLFRFEEKSLFFNSNIIDMCFNRRK